MLALRLNPAIYGFQRLPETAIELDIAQEIAKKSALSPQPLRCYRCQHPITTHQHRIEVAGHHEHTFINPAGFRFYIGCFAQASGCATEGTLTDEFTWFHGFRWNYALCGHCHAHLGWYYQAVDTDSFYGLIIDRLQERK